MNQSKQSRCCRSCGNEKPQTVFGVDRATPDGIHRLCKACVAQAYRSRVERSRAIAPTVKPPATKECRRCGEIKPRSAFHRYHGWPDGLQRICKDCASARSAASYQRNRAKRLAAEAARRQADPEEDRAKKQRWAEANRGKVRDQKRAYRNRQGDGLKAYFAEYRQRYIEAVRAYGRRWNRANKDKVYENTHRRHVRLRNALAVPIDPLAIFERDGWVCQLCGHPVDPSLGDRHPMMRSLDHVIPISKGGNHEPSNVQLAHLVCNMRKGDRVLEDEPPRHSPDRPVAP